MQATVYIPNLNGSARLGRLLTSLERQTRPCGVVVVDNGSEDDSVAMVRTRFPRVRIVELDRNLGFGVALNLAIAGQAGDPIVLVNNDVQCEPEFIEAMLDALDPGVDMVAGVLTQSAEPGTIDSAGVIADRRTLMAFDHLNGRPVRDAAEAPPPLGPTGGAALYRRDAFEAVGGFDERIFAYYEDLDLALRLRAHGANCALAHQARARHLSSATLGSRSGQKYELSGWSRAYMLRRYGVMSSPRRIARTVLCEMTMCAGQIILDRTARGAKGRIRGWQDAGALEKRALPNSQLAEIPLLPALTRRFRRHGQIRSRPPAVVK